MNGGVGGVNGCVISVDGRVRPVGWSTDCANLVEKACVDLRLFEPSSFDIKLALQQEAGTIDAAGAALEPGTEICISFGPSLKESKLLRGQITMLEQKFGTNSPSTISVSGFDMTRRLDLTSRTRAWGDGAGTGRPAGALFAEIVNRSGPDSGPESGMSAARSCNSGSDASRFAQVNSSDRVACDWAALLAGGFTGNVAGDVQSSNDGDIGIVRLESDARPAAIFTRTPGTDDDKALPAGDVTFRKSLYRQYRAVEVRWWDSSSKRLIHGMAETPAVGFGGRCGGEAAGMALWSDRNAGRILRVTDIAVGNNDEAAAVALRILTRCAFGFVRARLKTSGVPDVVPGRTIEFRGFGKDVCGTYIVTAARHVLEPAGRGYSMDVECARTDCPVW